MRPAEELASISASSRGSGTADMEEDTGGEGGGGGGVQVKGAIGQETFRHGTFDRDT